MASKNLTSPTSEPTGASRTRWSQLSDDQLLQTDFLAADPTALPNLLTELPVGDELPEVEFAYDTSLTIGRRVRCVHCKFDNHNRGFVLAFSDGSRVLVGGTCGKKRYGADFTRIERDFDVARERAAYLARRIAALTAAPDFLRDLDILCGHPALRTLKTTRREFYASMGPLALALVEGSPDGQLFLTTKIRDFKAEERRYDNWERRMSSLTTLELAQHKRTGKDKPPRAPIFREDSTPFWVVQGLDFFRPGDGPEVLLSRLAARAHSAVGQLGGAPAKTADLKAFFKGMNELLDAIDAQIRRLSVPSIALGSENLAKITEWARQRLDKSYRYDGLTLRRADTELATEYEFRVPLSVGGPDASFIESFRAAINQR